MKACADLVVQEGETFDLEHVKALRVGGWGVIGFARPHASRRDRPLELQNSVTNVHLTQVPEVMRAFISAQTTALENTQHNNRRYLITPSFAVPFGCFSHEFYVQVPTGKVVPVGSGLAVEACAEAAGRRRPAESPDVWRKDSVQHLYVRQLGRRSSTAGFRFDPSRNGHTQTTELTRAQVNGYDLEHTKTFGNLYFKYTL